MRYTTEEIDNYNFEYELDKNGKRQLTDHLKKYPDNFKGNYNDYKRKWKPDALKIGGIDSNHRKCDRCGKLCGDRYPYSNKVKVKAQWSSKYFYQNTVRPEISRKQYREYEADLCNVCIETLQIQTWSVSYDGDKE